MTQPNPFSMANSLEHLVNPKIVLGLTGYQVAVDIANVDTYYGRQLGGSTSSQEFQQAFIRQLGTTGLPSTQAFINQIGISGSSGSAFFNQIGSVDSRGDAYFDTVYWNNLVPYPSGGGGGTTFFNGPGISIEQNSSGVTLSADFQGIQGIQVNTPVSGPITIGYSAPVFLGSTGVNVSFANNIYRFSSSLGISGSQYIGVQQTGNTYTISYLGSQGGTGSSPITGISGAYAVFGASGLQSSTVLNSSNIVGPTGYVMLYSPNGPEYSNSLNLLEGQYPTLYTPFVESKFSNGILSLVPFTNQNYIESAGTNAKGFPLQISGKSGTRVLTKFDIPQGLVTINPNQNQANGYPSGVSVLDSDNISRDYFYGASGAAYNIYMWGGGGGGSVFPGGAGGFVKLENVIAGPVGITFNFSSNVSPGGGGNSLGLGIDNGSGLLAAAVVPGGGAGGLSGVGAAFGEPGGSYPGQGFSAGVTGGTGGIYSEFETNGTTGFVYRLGTTGVTAQSGIFENVQVTYGLIGNLSAGTKIIGYGVIPNVLGVTFATYYFPPGSTLIFQTDGITFENSAYSLIGVTYGILDLALPLSSLTGATLNRQADGGTFTIDTLRTDQEIENGYITGAFIGDGSGINQMLIGSTFSNLTTGLTLTVNYGTVFSDFGISGGIQIEFSGGLTFYLSRSLGSVLAPKINIIDPIFVVPNSIIQVQYQNTVSHGEDGVLAPAIGPTGSGYGFYTGGGGTAGGGGGAGSAIFLSGFTGITEPSSGTIPYADTYNLAGFWGFGGSGGQGGPSHYVIELISPGYQPNVLQVNGSETINGGLLINGYLSGSGNNSIYASNDITAVGALQSDRISVGSATRSGGAILGNDGSNFSLPVNFPAGLSGAASSFSGLVTTQGGITSGGPVTINSSGSPLTIGGSLYSFPPVGAIIMYGAAASPPGWLICNGSPVPVQYTELIALIGANLPDLRSRVPLGLGQGAGLTNYPTMFGSGGNENSTLPSHTHTINDPTHTHGILSQGGGFAAADGGNGNRANNNGTSSASSTGITINSAGSSATGTNLPPYLVVNYIIKY